MTRIEPDSPLYTEAQKLAYSLIKDREDIDKLYKANPLSAGDYICNLYWSLVNDINSIYSLQKEVIVKTNVFQQPTYNSDYIVGVEQKTPLRLFLEKALVEVNGLQFSDGGYPEAVFIEPLYILKLVENPFIEALWYWFDDMYGSLCSIQDIEDDGYRDSLSNFFICAQLMNSEEFDLFLEKEEYNQHQVFELKLLFSGE